MSDLNISLEYLPITKELKDVSSLKNKDAWLEQTGQDLFNNPRFQINPNTTCTVQTSKNGKWYIAFLRVSELVDNSYVNTYFKSFAPREEYGSDNNPVYFDRFEEWIKDEETGRWVRKG